MAVNFLDGKPATQRFGRAQPVRCGAFQVNEDRRWSGLNLLEARSPSSAFCPFWKLRR
jgi:hypothetical protein